MLGANHWHVIVCAFWGVRFDLSLGQNIPVQAIAGGPRAIVGDVDGVHMQKAAIRAPLNAVIFGVLPLSQSHLRRDVHLQTVTHGCDGVARHPSNLSVVGQPPAAIGGVGKHPNPVQSTHITPRGDLVWGGRDEEVTRNSRGGQQG